MLPHSSNRRCSTWPAEVWTCLDGAVWHSPVFQQPSSIPTDRSLTIPTPVPNARDRDRSPVYRVDRSRPKAARLSPPSVCWDHLRPTHRRAATKASALSARPARSAAALSTGRPGAFGPRREGKIGAARPNGWKWKVWIPKDRLFTFGLQLEQRDGPELIQLIKQLSAEEGLKHLDCGRWMAKRC